MSKQRRMVRGFLLPDSKVVVELRPGEEMPDREEFAQTMQRIKGRAGARTLWPVTTIHGSPWDTS